MTAEIKVGDDGELELRQHLTSVLGDIRNGQAAGFAALERALQNKADKADVMRLETRLDEHQRLIERNTSSLGEMGSRRRDEEVREAERQRHDEDRWTLRSRLWVVGFGVLSLLAIIFGSAIGHLLVT